MKRLPIVFLTFELGKSARLLEERTKCLVHIFKAGLQGLTIDFFQPSRFGLGFQLRQVGLNVETGKVNLVNRIGFRLFIEGVVVYPPGATAAADRLSADEWQSSAYPLDIGGICTL